MTLKDFIYEFNLTSTITVKDSYEWMNILNNNISKEIDYSNSISLYYLVDAFNQLYLKFKKDQMSLPNLGISGDTRIVRYYNSVNNEFEITKIALS